MRKQKVKIWLEKKKKFIVGYIFPHLWKYVGTIMLSLLLMETFAEMISAPI